jgi:hypothetical protein
MVLGSFRNPFKSEFLGVVFKCGMVSAPFRNCITLYQGLPNIFRLNFEDWSNGFEGQFFPEFIPWKGMEREELVGTKVGIDKCVVESQVVRVSFRETFSDD